MLIWQPLGYNRLQNVLISEHSELLLTFLIIFSMLRYVTSKSAGIL